METMDMTPDNRKKLRDLIVGSETYKQFPYTDTTGHLTIGIGRNLDDRGVSLNEALEMLDNDITYFANRLNHNLDFFTQLSDVRRMVLISMCFNLGVVGLLNFKKMLAALASGDYETAANEIVDSKAHNQTGERYDRLADMMRTDEYVNGH
jgi:lysozyme